MQGLYNFNPYDLMPEVLKTPESEAFGYSVQEALKKLLNYADGMELYSDLEKVPNEILDSMALELRTQYYDQQAPRKIREGLVRQTLAWYMHGGTCSTLEEYLSTLYEGGVIEEWYQYGGNPYYFKAIVTVAENDEIKLGESKSITQRVQAYENVRSWLEALIFCMHFLYPVPIRYENEIAIQSEFYPRYNLAYLYLNTRWLLNSEKKLNGYDSRDILDFYPVCATILSETMCNAQLEVSQKHIMNAEQIVCARVDMNVSTEVKVFNDQYEITPLYVDGSARMDGNTDMSGCRDYISENGAFSLYMNGSTFMDGEDDLSGYKKKNLRPEISVRSMTDLKITVSYETTMTEEHHIAYMDQTWKLDGKRDLDAYFTYHAL